METFGKTGFKESECCDWRTSDECPRHKYNFKEMEAEDLIVWGRKFIFCKRCGKAFQPMSSSQLRCGNVREKRGCAYQVRKEQKRLAAQKSRAPLSKTT